MLHRGIAIACSAIALITGLGVTHAQSNPYNPNNYDTTLIMNEIFQPHGDLVLVSAHRGFHTEWNGNGPVGVPENSLAAIGKAAQAGIEVIEVDIRLTSDGVPVLSHDSVWGRETDFVAAGFPALPPYNPFTNQGANPLVNSLTEDTLATWNPSGGTSPGVHLRDSVNFTVTQETPPTLQAVLDYVKANQIAAVLALDIKDNNAAQATWQVVAHNVDYRGIPYYQSTLFKMDAFTYPTPLDFQNAFNGNTIDRNHADFQYIAYWPVYQTSQIGPNKFGSEDAIISSLSSFQRQRLAIASEVDLKQPGGILSTLNTTAPQGPFGKATEGNFNAVAEWIDPNDPNATFQFFNSNGSCCSALSAYYYNGAPNGQPSDTADFRTSLSFITSNGNFNMVTTDDSVVAANILSANGLRNLSYIEAPSCAPGAICATPNATGVNTLYPRYPSTFFETVPPTPAQFPPGEIAQPAQRVAYFDSWAVYGQNYFLKNLDTQGIAQNLTTLVYSFENIDPVNLTCLEANQPAGTNPASPTNFDGASDAYSDYQMGFTTANSVNGTADQWGQPLEGNFNQILQLKAKYPNLKVLVSIGGWTYSKFFSDVAATEASRQKFVSSCITMYINGNLPVLATSPAGGAGAAAGVFDGFDIDWEYPASANGNVGNDYSPADTANFTALLAEFRAELNDIGGKHLLLTATLPAGPTEINSIQLSQIGQYLDFGDVMAYDMHGAFETNGPTNFQSPMFDVKSNPAYGTLFDINDAITSYLNGGFPSAKLNLGVPFYGRGWTGVPDGGTHGLYQTVTGPTAAFQYSQQAGVADYKELEAAGELNNLYFDGDNVSSWAYDGTNFFTFDTPYTLTLKRQYIQSMGLGGIMMYALENDDANNSLFNAAAGPEIP